MSDQTGAFEVFAIGRINKQAGAFFYFFNDRFAQFLRYGGATLAATQPSVLFDKSFTDVLGSVQDNGPLFGRMVDALLDAFQPQR